jgi:predicted nucleotidyltransferase
MANVAEAPLRALVEAHRDEINTVAARHKGRRVAIFGSVARGDETADSDIDFLVDFGEGSSLFDLMHLEDDLITLLGRPVDVVALGGLLPRDHDIRADAVWL